MSDIPANPAVDAAAPPAADVGIKVFAGNLAYSTDEAQLRQFFSSFESDILTVQLMQRPYRREGNAGYGFVSFKSDEAADKAVAELNSQELDGRQVVVERARPIDHTKERKPRRKFSGRRGSKAVPGEATEAKTDGSAPATADAAVNGGGPDGEGALKKKKKRSNKKRTKKPAVEGEAAEGATNAAPADGAAAGEEKTKKPRKPRAPRRPRPERGPGEPSKTVLFVANLAFSVDEEQLTEFFASNGAPVKSARVVRRPFGNKRSKGYAFVDVGDEEEQQKAIAAVQGKALADREVTVKVAVDRPIIEKEDDDADYGEAVADFSTPVAAVA